MAEGGGEGTVGKALEVLEAVAAHGRPVRFAELQPGSPFPKATLYRLLQTLTQQGMLRHDPEGGHYSLGLRLVRLAHSAWATATLAPIARPWLDRLAQETGETVHLAQLDQGQVLYIDKRHASRPVAMYSGAGKVGPAYCTGVGKAMLAHLPPPALAEALTRQSFHRFTPATLDSPDRLCAELAVIRAKGHALDREEHEPGIICCAVPILAQGGRVIGALSLTSTTLRSTLAALEARAPDLTAMAAEIAKAAETWQFPETP